jgi:hypothetical protein
MMATCAWCGAPRSAASTCGKCGADYDKAASLRAQEALVPVVPAAGVVVHPTGRAWTAGEEELATERKLRLLAPPLTLLVAVAFHATSIGHFLQRTFLTMMVHEVGHAVTAWYCGRFAIPMLWKTYVAPRPGLTVVALLLGHAYVLFRVWKAQKAAWITLAVALLLLQLVLSFGCGERTQGALISFGGDGGAMILGVALMATFFAPRDHHVVTSWLRWGFLVIGAAAFVDTFATWWTARHDWDVIPFGEIEGVGLSDPSKLTDVYAWTTKQLVGRYVWVGAACLAALTILWVRGVRALPPRTPGRRTNSSVG